MRRVARACVVIGVVWCVMLAPPASAQNAAPQPSPIVMGPPLPPATLLEGFRPAAGSILTVGYDDLGEVAGVSVDVREIRDSAGGRVRGVVVEITGAQSVREQSFVDADELPGLLKAFDALLAVTGNPTEFKSFEMHYATKGELDLMASSSRNHGVVYAVEVGRLVKARRAPLTAGELHQLRTLFEVAAQKLSIGP
jgi:hypothetical protein